MWITSINATTIIVNWVPNYLWRGYQIDHYNINITNINNKQRVVTTTIPSTILSESILNPGQYIFSKSLQPCTEFNFSISSVSVTYGESSPTFIIGGFDEGITIYDIVLHHTYSTAILEHKLASQSIPNFP